MDDREGLSNPGSAGGGKSPLSRPAPGSGSALTQPQPHPGQAGVGLVRRYAVALAGECRLGRFKDCNTVLLPDALRVNMG